MKTPLLALMILLLALSLFGCASAHAEISDTTYCEWFDCDGSTTEFNVSFNAANGTDILVYLRRESTGAQTEVSSDDYTVSATNNDYSGGFTLTTDSTYADGYFLVVERVTPHTQTTSFPQSRTIERTLDRFVRMVQEIGGVVTGRCLKYAATDQSDPNLATSVERANTTFCFDENGDPLFVAGVVSAADATVSAFWKAVLVMLDLDTSLTQMGLETIEVSSYCQDWLDANDAGDLLEQIGLDAAMATYLQDANNFEASPITVVNMTGTTIPAYTWVYVTGAASSWVSVAVADQNAVATCRAFGITIEDIATSSTGSVITAGRAYIQDITPGTLDADDILYLGNDGEAQNSAPTTGYVVPLGYMIYGTGYSSALMVVDIDDPKPATSGTLVLDDGTTEKITLVITNGQITSRTVEGTTSTATIDWTD